MSTDPRPSISNTKRAALFKLHGGICHICGQKIDGTRERWEIEHIIMRAMIGKLADTDDNMQPAHIACHKVKTGQDRKNLAKSDATAGGTSGLTSRRRRCLPVGTNPTRKPSIEA
ncbi:MAG: hypothetical protein K0S56_4106 [Microvirga sp.]|jgi:5-methylcytosine-specific restriction endonuclease McrA|nr:hypothetical protein [Microvirga sp.]